MSDAPRVKNPGVWQLSMLLPIVTKAAPSTALNDKDGEDLRMKLLDQLEKAGLREFPVQKK